MQTAIIKATGKRVKVYPHEKSGKWAEEQVYSTHRTQVKSEWFHDAEELKMVPTFYTKESEEMLKNIRLALINEGIAEVHNEYETFYGVGFDQWLKDGLKDLNPTYEVTSYNRWEGYPWTYIITIDIDELAGGAPSPKH